MLALERSDGRPKLRLDRACRGDSRRLGSLLFDAARGRGAAARASLRGAALASAASAASSFSMSIAVSKYPSRIRLRRRSMSGACTCTAPTPSVVVRGGMQSGGTSDVGDSESTADPGPAPACLAHVMWPTPARGEQRAELAASGEPRGDRRAAKSRGATTGACVAGTPAEAPRAGAMLPSSSKGAYGAFS